MREFANYFVLGFSALLPLINPPGSALELLGIMGVGEDKPYKLLAKKIAINTTLFLAVVALTGPYVLQFFGISVEVLEVVGGGVLAAMGWHLLNKPEGEKQMSDPNLRRAAENCVANAWPIESLLSVHIPANRGSGLSPVMLTLSAQAKSLQFADRIGAFLGHFGCIAFLSIMVFVFYAYAPFAAEKVPSALAHGGLRIIAFLLICIGAQIAWHGLRPLLLSAAP